MRIPCDLNVVVIDWVQPQDLELLTDTCPWYVKLPDVWQTYPHTGSLEIATAAVCVWRRMVDNANDGHLLPRSLRE